MLIEYDVTRTYKEVDKELGRGRALVPEFMSTASPIANIGHTGHVTSMIPGMSSGMPRDVVITRYPSKSLEDNKPTSIQFDLRTEQWRNDIAGTIGDICSAFGLSVIDYDPRLLQMGQRTDDEINAMTDITRSTVEDKREIAEESINAMLNQISKFYNVDEPVFIRWSMRAILNPTKNNSLIGQQLAQGTISQETAIRRENPDFTKEEVEEELQRIKGERQAQSVDRQFEEF
jgi:hypothetical protein